jgi:hypothetical protein
MMFCLYYIDSRRDNKYSIAETVLFLKFRKHDLLAYFICSNNPSLRYYSLTSFFYPRRLFGYTTFCRALFYPAPFLFCAEFLAVF